MQTICIEIDDLTGNEVAIILNVFSQYFDFEGKRTAWSDGVGLSFDDNYEGANEISIGFAS